MRRRAERGLGRSTAGYPRRSAGVAELILRGYGVVGWEVVCCAG